MRRCWRCAIKRWDGQQAAVEINTATVGGTIDGFGEDAHGDELPRMAEGSTHGIARFVGHKLVGDTTIPGTVETMRNFKGGEFQVAVELRTGPDGC
jgi:hypothetical protein